MMKKTVNDVIIQVLHEAKTGLTSKQIYELIASKKLYTFNTKNGENIVRNQLRRHSENLPENKVSSKTKHYVFDNGKFRIK